jgi:DNA modification methylase
MINLPIPRLDKDSTLKQLLLPYCRIKAGNIWLDKINGHKIGCLDASDSFHMKKLMGKWKAVLAVQDPPYNLVAFDFRTPLEFVNWSKKWIVNTKQSLAKNSSLYIWLGADQTKNFQPFAEFIQMMNESGFTSRSFITMRNQRGYGTQKNWMSVRQELLYYCKGKPYFNINAEYTGIPKVLNGYYKKVKGKVKTNFDRSKSQNIRAGNVWIDIQQIFYRMEENVNGCYAQKPIKAIERIINSASKKNDLVIDFFSHAGTTLIAAEIMDRKCFTSEIDPIYCEITLRRLERFRKTGKLGWQNSNPFEEEIIDNKKIRTYLKNKYKLKI